MDQLREDSDINFSLDKEREVARAFMGRMEWEHIVIGLGQFCVWLATWILVLSHVIPVWSGCVIATISTAFAYLPSHAGQHGHFSGKHGHFTWLNALVSQISLIPLAQSHDILKATHMKHHAQTNDPKRDPDYYHTHVDNWLQAAVKIQLQTGDGKFRDMLKTFAEEDAGFSRALGRGTVVSTIFLISQMVIVVIYPIETLLLWWIPRKLATSYLGVTFSHAPHKNLSVGRYKDTRFWSNIFPRYLNHSMQIHAMHHMYPKICHFDEPKAIQALKPFMVARGMPGVELLPDRVIRNPLVRAIS